ncbi:MAG TPA: tetratricopeptide repeat protein [Tepidisphaeraceae bacterium]|nr:tetratricopeptide repeat protein [Tepidisphaeraceae bacterium]
MDQTAVLEALRVQQAGRNAEAQAMCRAVLAREADNGEAFYVLGLAVQAMGRADEAGEYYRRATELQPTLAEAWCNLGIVRRAQKRAEEALACFETAISVRGNVAELYNNFGLMLYDVGRCAESITALEHALRLRPDFPEALNNLATTFQKVGRATEAVECYRKAARLQPDSPVVFSNLGNVLIKSGRVDEALACYDRSLTLRPDHAEVLNNAGIALKESGRLDDAMACFERARAIKPEYATAHSSRLYTIHFHPAFSSRMILDEHRQWNARHAHGLTKNSLPHPNDRSPDRRLRIGYVSPDFRDHVVARFMLPLLAHHDHANFEIFSYTDVARPDEMTARLRRHTDTWRQTLGMSDDQLARLIREDQIDILVDLTMHMGSNRLLTFARKPAPVQVTYLAYCSTTGLEAIDYRLTDPYLDPNPEKNGDCYTERSIYLPVSYWCYADPGVAPPVGPLVAAGAGRITFGCLNNFAKVSAPTIQVWSRVLHAVPDSRLVVHSGLGGHRKLFCDRMAALGIDAARIEFAGIMRAPQYFEEYRRIDIALDPFPYVGGTTTLDALWMGVPVVSLAGETAVSRAGLSILSNLGLAEFVTRGADDYVKKAAELAGDLTRLSELRRILRERLQHSPLMDAPRFARDIEGAYREMWKRASRINWKNDI